MNVLFVSSEVSPFAKTGGLGDVSEALPLALNRLGINCKVISPFYRLVRKNGYTPQIVRSNISVKLGGEEIKFNLFSIDYKDTRFYFIQNDAFYDRDGLYGTPQGDYEDNGLRFGFFAKAVLASIPYIGKVDIIHCNDWQSGLIPLYLKILGNPPLKVLFTIHNLAYQGIFKKDIIYKLSIPENVFTINGIEYYGDVSFIKSGIVFADAISTVSERYAKEILTEEFGCGLEGILSTRQDAIYGILNGVDYSTWDPRIDKYIIRNFSQDNIEAKLECKKDLAEEFGISFDKETPFIGMITRLAHQKGIDLVVDAMADILNLGVNFVILGSGDERYNTLTQSLSQRFRGRVGTRIAFDNPLAHKIEAGCDMFLMPSRYEPCGLNQMYSLKYATVPIVRATGGLDDTIVDFDPQAKEGNGFKFKEATTVAMIETVRRAVGVFKDKATWHILQKNGLKCNFSWEVSAKRYIDLYNKITG